MAANPTTCSNCGTENAPGQDFCTNCDQPLTASADQGLRENQAAQDRGGLIAGDAVGLGADAPPLASDTGVLDDGPRPLI